MGGLGESPEVMGRTSVYNLGGLEPRLEPTLAYVRPAPAKAGPMFGSFTAMWTIVGEELECILGFSVWEGGTSHGFCRFLQGRSGLCLP